MKAPDGFICIFKDKGGTKIEVEQRELIMCRNCKHCRQSTAYDGTTLYCYLHRDDMGYWEFLENDEGFCSWAERKEE